MERPPAHVAKPPEILDAQGQESDQSSECSIFQYENRLNSTGAVEQHRSDSSDTMLRGGLLAYHQTGSLPNINEMSSHSMFHNRLDPEDPSDNVFNSPLTGRNSIPYFDFGTGGGVMKNSTSSNQVYTSSVKCCSDSVCNGRRPREVEDGQGYHRGRKSKEKNFA